VSAPTIAMSDNRNLQLGQLIDLLRDQSTRRLDVKAGSGRMRAAGGHLILEDTEPELGPDGVTMTAGVYRPNDIANAGLADKLGIPTAYLRKLAVEHLDLYDENVNGWLTRTDRRFLIRVLRNHTGGGVARAVLSTKYARIDNLDVAMSALEGIRRADAAVDVVACDLTDRRMYVKMISPEIQVMAPKLLANYRSPFNGRSGRDLPVVSAGLAITNSETGCGAFSIQPWVRFEVCSNGLVIGENVLRRAHLGGRLADEDGVVEWSTETNTKALELITSRATDAVKAFLDADYIAEMLHELEAAAGAELREPDTTLKIVGKQLRYTEEQQDSILAHFIRGADISAGGVMHAVTSVAQTLADADAAFDLESSAVQAMRLAAANA
jgi:hypothetical protein